MANIFVEAKKIQRKHPKLDWQACIQKAKRQHKAVGSTKPKKKSSRQTGSSNKKYDQQRSARPPGARIPAGAKKVTYYERRKNRSDAPGQLTGVSSAQLTNALKKRLMEKENALVLKKYRATRKTDKRKIQKEISTTKQQLRKLS